MFNFSKIFGRHEIDAWRDERTLAAAAVLNQVAADLACSFEDELRSATLKDCMIAPGKFIATRVAPVVKEVCEPVVEKIVDRANRQLQNIVTYQAVWNDTARHLPEADSSAAALHDVALAAAPLAAGVATGVASVTMGVTTTTYLGLFVTGTAISWPVVIVGGAVAGAGIATGLLNTSRIRAKAEERLRRRVHDHVVAVLIEGPAEQPSVLEQLAAMFARTAQEAKRL
jgi:hypothetical protein